MRIYYEIEKLTDKLAELAELAATEAGNYTTPSDQDAINEHIERLNDDLMSLNKPQLEDLILVLDYITLSLTTGGIQDSTLQSIIDALIPLEDELIAAL